MSVEMAGASKPPRFSAGLTRVLVIVLTVLVVLLGGAVVGLQIAKPGGDGLDGARSSALTSATTRVPKMLTYSYKTIDSDITTATSQVTGSFKKQFSSLMSTQVRSGALAGKITTTAKAVEAGVVSASAARVTVLVFLNLTTTSGANATPQINGSRVEVVMTKVGKTWLVSKVTPV
jgi:Mce-associated membrane protein